MSMRASASCARALRLARRTGSAEREADVLASLGVALVYAGRTAAGLAAFDRAVRLSNGVLAGRVLHRRGHVLWTLGRYPAALEDLRRAVSVLQRAGDPVWTARALNGRGLVYLAVGCAWPRGCRLRGRRTPVRRRPARNWNQSTRCSTADWPRSRSGDLPAALVLPR